MQDISLTTQMLTPAGIEATARLAAEFYDIDFDRIDDPAAIAAVMEERGLALAFRALVAARRLYETVEGKALAA